MLNLLLWYIVFIRYERAKGPPGRDDDNDLDDDPRRGRGSGMPRITTFGGGTYVSGIMLISKIHLYCEFSVACEC